MNLKDRTAEFRSIVKNSTNSAFYNFTQPANDAASAFIQTANKISRAYTSTVPSQLDQLRKLAKNCSLFDERPQQEFTALSESLKRHLSLLNRTLQDLKNLDNAHHHHDQNNNKTSFEHQKALLLILQTWIAQGFKSLESINEERNEVLKAQRSRKDQFGSNTVTSTATYSTSAYAQPSTQPSTHSSAPISRTQTPPLPPLASQQTASPRMRQLDPHLRPNILHVDVASPTNSASKKYDDHVAIELQDQQQQSSLLYQEQQEPLLGSLRNRSTALNTIESTINELGTIYQQLAHMVSQQGDVVQRIDMNIEDMSFNVQRGQNELARYLRRVSNSRMFIAKIFAALIVFIILMKFLFW